MPHTRRTLTLDRDTWDLVKDGIGRIAVTRGDLATAQNVANESRLFTQDAYFIQDRGIPHYNIELGHKLGGAALRSLLIKAARRVPDVIEILSVDMVNFDYDTRVLSGDIRFRTALGEITENVTTYF